VEEPDRSVGDDGDEAAGEPIGPAIAIIVLLLAATGLVLLIDPLRDAALDALNGSTDELREDLRGLGAGGVALVLGLAMVHSVIFYPAEILDTAAGFIYGFWPALALMMAGWLLNGVICWAIGRNAARPLLTRVVGAERFGAYERMVERGGIPLLLAIRVIPIVPFSLFSYAAGSARVPLGRFVWTTLVGYLPITAISVYFGSRLEDFDATDPVLLGGFALLAILILLARGVVRRGDAGNRSGSPDNG
jgi:uncharacterized membrane protein YdjX (TVP38/TMEM64 family)